MAAAVPIVADIVVSALVSKVATTVVTEVAKGLGADDKTANLLGGIGGIVAGTYTYGMASDAINAGKGAATANDAANAGKAASQSGQLAEQTAEFGEAGYAATSEALSANTAAKATKVNNSLMTGYVYSPATQAVQAAGSGVNTGASQAVSEATSTSDLINAKDTPWYESLWDKDTKARTIGGFVQGATGAVLQGEAEQDLYDQKHADQVADRDYKAWKKPVEVKGIRSIRDVRRGYAQPVASSRPALMQPAYYPMSAYNQGGAQ